MVFQVLGTVPTAAAVEQLSGWPARECLSFFVLGFCAKEGTMIKATYSSWFLRTLAHLHQARLPVITVDSWTGSLALAA